MKDHNKGYLWLIPLTVAVVPGIALAARNKDPLAVIAGTVAALAVGVALVVVAKWLFDRKTQ